MGLLSSLLPERIETRDRGVGIVAKASESAGWLEDLLGGGVSTAGRRVNEQSAMTVSAVYSGLRVLSSSLAQLPLNVMERTEDGRRRDRRNHRLYSLLNEAPNDQITAIEFRELLTSWALLHGNAVGWLDLRGDGTIEQILPLEPSRVSFWLTPNERELVVRYQKKDGTQEWIPRYRFLHLRAPLGNRWLGAGLLQLARDAIGLGMVAEEHASRFYSNAAAPAGVLTSPKPMKTDTFKKLREQWNARHQGAENAFKTAILEDGVDWKPIALNLKDQQFLETRTFQVQEIARWIGIPPHLIGELSRSTNNNIEAQGIEFVTFAIGPWARRWEQRIWLDCLGIGERRTVYVRHNLDAFLRGQTLDRYRAYQIGRMGGWLSANDVRVKEDMDPIEDGDTYMAPLNMVPAASFDDPSPDVPPAEPGDEPGTQPGGTAPDLTRSARTMIAALTPSLYDVAQRAEKRAAGERSRHSGELTADQVEGHRQWCRRALDPVARGLAVGVARDVGIALEPDEERALVDIVTLAVAERWTTQFRNASVSATTGTQEAADLLTQLTLAQLSLTVRPEA